jgi:hypothetical protein
MARKFINHFMRSSILEPDFIPRGRTSRGWSCLIPALGQPSTQACARGIWKAACSMEAGRLLRPVRERKRHGHGREDSIVDFLTAKVESRRIAFAPYRDDSRCLLLPPRWPRQHPPAPVTPPRPSGGSSPQHEDRPRARARQHRPRHRWPPCSPGSRLRLDLDILLVGGRNR